MTQRRDSIVNFWEFKEILEQVDLAAKESGSNRSTFIREAVREKLKSAGDSAKK